MSSILSLNEIPPLFPNNPPLTVPEDYSPGALLYTYTAADLDAAPHGVQEYQLSTVLSVNEMAPLFPNNPTLTVPEDYSPGALLYTYTAADLDAAPHGVQEYQLSTVLSVNEMAPLFPNNPTLTVPEDYSPGALLYTYTAADSDAAPHGVQKYQLVSGEYCFVCE